MFEVYDENTEEDMMKSVLREDGLLEDEEERQEPDVAERTNSLCRETLERTEEFCPSCGMALSPDAAQNVEDAKGGVLDDAFAPDASASDQQVARVLIDLPDTSEGSEILERAALMSEE